MRFDNGYANPLGVTQGSHTEYNFAIFSSHARYMVLLLYLDESDEKPFLTHVFDPLTQRTGHIWHVQITGLTPPFFYHYSCDGKKKDDLIGYRFNPKNRLLDPYAKAISCRGNWNTKNPSLSYKNAYYNESFDWQDDVRPDYPLQNCIIYEAHLKGLSRLANVDHPGTYLGVIQMIPYLKDLGITTLELLPIFQFNPDELLQQTPDAQPLRNYWGYSSIAFFIPHNEYASGHDLGAPIREFKTMVRALHQAGIEIILDIVFNHTAEGNEHGPTFSFKGLDNPVYYMLFDDQRYYWSYSGCGNTLNANHAVVTRFIIDALRYWVEEMHVDGFRFDLAAAMCRDEYGHLMEFPPLFERITNDPILSKVKMIVEPWDAGGGYLVGQFPYGIFAEWNDKFRDAMRAYWRGDAHRSHDFAMGFMGFPNLYKEVGKTPLNCVNYVTAHDGFTLMDLVSYEKKNNLANGEDNRDGWDHNLSWNCGEEGPCDSGPVHALRMRQIKNFFLTLLLSQGIPMLCAGDEIGRTQHGNNNAYCQDNPMSWIDYQLLDKYREIYDFVRKLIKLRNTCAAFGRTQFFDEHGMSPEIQWLNTQAQPINWHAMEKPLACYICHQLDDGSQQRWLLLTNPTTQVQQFSLPIVDHACWYVQVDTAQDYDHDIYDFLEGPIGETQTHQILQPHSSVLLFARIT